MMARSTAIRTPQARLNGRRILREWASAAGRLAYWIFIFAAVAFFAVLVGHVLLTATLKAEADTEQARLMRAM